VSGVFCSARFCRRARWTLLCLATTCAHHSWDPCANITRILGLIFVSRALGALGVPLKASSERFGRSPAFERLYICITFRSSTPLSTPFPVWLVSVRSTASTVDTSGFARPTVCADIALRLGFPGTYSVRLRYCTPRVGYLRQSGLILYRSDRLGSIWGPRAFDT
jgi:hypothetical protein